MKRNNTASKEIRKYRFVIIIAAAILVIGVILVDRLIPKEEVDSSNSYIIVHTSREKYENQVLSNYEEYKKLLKDINQSYTLTKNDFQKNKYLALFLEETGCREVIKKVTLQENKTDRIRVKVNVDVFCGYCAPSEKLYFVPINKHTSDSAKIKVDVKERKAEKCQEYTVDKPIIYLYPETTQEINVRLGNPENVIRSYPVYQNGWRVLAEPSGKLTDLNTNKNYYSLYWEGKLEKNKDYTDGFIVKKEDLIPFFEEKLSILGLSYKESEEFIIYWLKELDSNDYTYIRFMTSEEINSIMPLEVTPPPTSTIRVWMQYKKVNKDYQVKEQKLTSPTREGFALVEWGGTELK